MPINTDVQQDVLNIPKNKADFENLVRTYIKREGVDALLKWLEKSDFYTAPATAQYLLSVEGGLCQYSMLVFKHMYALACMYYGTPTETGVFAYTVVTEGGEGDAASAKGVLSVAAPGNAEEVATKKEASKVDASTPDAGIGWSETTNTGFVEKGYFNFDNSTASYGTWNLHSEHTASTTISIRFANGGSAARDMELVVNGVKVGTVSMDATGGWTTWLTTDAKIDLAKGLNTITLKSTTADGGANVDMFYFDIEGVSAYAGQVDEQTTITPVAASVRGMVFNPSTGVLYTPKAGLAEIYFYDMSGAMRLGISKNVSAGSTAMAHDQELLPKGMYLVKVKLNGKAVFAKKFAKQ